MEISYHNEDSARRSLLILNVIMWRRNATPLMVYATKYVNTEGWERKEYYSHIFDFIFEGWLLGEELDYNYAYVCASYCLLYQCHDQLNNTTYIDPAYEWIGYT